MGLQQQTMLLSFVDDVWQTYTWGFVIELSAITFNFLLIMSLQLFPT